MFTWAPTGYTKDMSGTTHESQPRQRRPNPAQWLWYAYGGRLPDTHREWVMHDVTTRRWLLRHLIRTATAALLPLAVVFVALAVFAPLPTWNIVIVVGIGLLFILFYSVVAARNLVRVRLAKHGLSPEVSPPPTHALPEDAERK